MKKLSMYLNEELIRTLGEEIKRQSFPGLTLEQAMQFILSDGILPADNLPVAAFLKLEDWVRARENKTVISYTTTELKNKTGEILDKVSRGNTIKLTKHGRYVAEIKPIS